MNRRASFNFGANAKKPRGKKAAKKSNKKSGGKPRGNAWRAYTEGGSSAPLRD